MDKELMGKVLQKGPWSGWKRQTASPLISRRSSMGLWVNGQRMDMVRLWLIRLRNAIIEWRSG